MHKNLTLKIKKFNTSNWDYLCAKYLLLQIKKIISKQNDCNIVLTGGVTAAAIYSHIAQQIDSNKIPSGINIYFTDERCVPTGSGQTNYENFLKNFSNKDGLKKIKIYPINGGTLDISLEATRYDSLFPDRIDILMLTIGNDGHIASLFRLTPELLKHNAAYIPVHREYPFASRISITPKTIKKAKKIFVLAKGKQKKYFINELTVGPSSNQPISLLLDANWLVDCDNKK